MSAVTVHDKLPTFKRNLYDVLSDAFKEAARDVVIDSKDKAPFKKGGLRSDVNVTKPSNLHYRITYHKEYAAIQELKQHQNYSTAGTGAHFLRNAGNAQVNKLKLLVRKHASRAKA